MWYGFSVFKWHNYIQIISMKYFYSIKNEIITLHYSFYILQSIFLVQKYSNFIYDTVPMKLLFCIMNYSPSCYQHFLSSSITPFVQGISMYTVS